MSRQAPIRTLITDETIGDVVVLVPHVAPVHVLASALPLPVRRVLGVAIVVIVVVTRIDHVYNDVLRSVTEVCCTPCCRFSSTQLMLAE